MLGCIAAAAIATACHERYTGPFRDPNAAIIPDFADSAFGDNTTWFKGRTFDSITAAGIDAQSLYAVEATSGTSTFVSLALSTGATRWSRTIPGGRDVVSDGTVAAAIAAGVSAFDVGTGGVAFTYTPSPARAVSSNGAVSGSSIIVGNANGEVVALNVADGTEAWATQVDARIDSLSVTAVSVSGATVFAGGDGFLAALDAATGALQWKRATTDTPRPFVSGPPGVDGGFVTVMTYTAGTWGIAAYNQATGALAWSVTGAGPAASAELPGLPSCDGSVFAESGAPGLSALASGSGMSTWSRSLATYSALRLSCANGSVITNGSIGSGATLRSEVQVLRTDDGTLLAQYPKAAGQALRMYRVLRNASALYVLTDRGVSAFPAP